MLNGAKSLSHVVVVDYGMGNLNSVRKALDRIGAGCVVSSVLADFLRADKIVLPGVGHFGKAMANLAARGLRGALDEAVLGRGKPVLGICLGMELMAKVSEEGDAEGLGWIDGEVRRVRPGDPKRYKVPHMGWNGVAVVNGSRLLKGVEPTDEFYFAHSYYLAVGDASAAAGETVYGSPFVSAVERGNIFGVQFHPEKSHDAGLKILKNFVEM